MVRIFHGASAGPVIKMARIAISPNEHFRVPEGSEREREREAFETD